MLSVQLTVFYELTLSLTYMYKSCLSIKSFSVFKGTSVFAYFYTLNMHAFCIQQASMIVFRSTEDLDHL